MISNFVDLEATNNGGVKTVSVFAKADANGANNETITLLIIDQTKTSSVTVAANNGATVSVNHTASGSGLVKVTNGDGSKSFELFLNVDGALGAP